MIQSNGICNITEIEAKLGDILKESFRDKIELDEWAVQNNIQKLSFWDYTDTKKKKPELHLVPSPHRNGLSNRETFLAFDHELALLTIFLGHIANGQIVNQ